MKPRGCLCSIFLVLFVFGTSWSANILYMSTIASPSHNIWDKTLATALKDRGHIITYVTHSSEKSTDNFTTILLEGIYEELYAHFELESMVNTTTLQNVHMFYDWIHASCVHDLKTQGFQSLLKLADSKVKYDAIIFDITSGLCFYPIVELFGYPPIIATSPFGIPTFVTEAFSIDLHSASIPHYAVTLSLEMTFFERIYNYFINMYDIALKNYSWGEIISLLEEFYGRDMKHVFNIERNFSVFLANYDPLFDYPRPLPPDVIPVGGLHTKRAKSLPEDLRRYLNNSKAGVIIFSLGTNIRSDKLSQHKKEIILETFAKLKQNVIWKFESDIENLPKNVIVRKFLPQNDILAHPNVKLLINHGGGLSTQEAMFHGVPLVSIPFFVDQRPIVHKIVNRKLGLGLNFDVLTTSSMYSAIQEVLHNPIYKQNAQLVSRRYRDRPDGPLDRAVFWVEHVLRNSGGHLRLAARDKPFYQTHLLDVWLFAIAVLTIIYLIAKRMICCIVASWISTRKQKTH